jgi:hypothetical protein
MKRLLVLLAVTMATGASGCRNCSPCRTPTAAYRPCTPAPTCCEGGEMSMPDAVYGDPGMSTPMLTVPPGVQTYPGPETYTPAP